MAGKGEQKQHQHVYVCGICGHHNPFPLIEGYQVTCECGQVYYVYDFPHDGWTFGYEPMPDWWPRKHANGPVQKKMFS